MESKHVCEAVSPTAFHISAPLFQAQLEADPQTYFHTTKCSHEQISFNMGPSRETLLATTNTFIRVMGGGTVDDVMSIRSPGCIQKTLPSTLKAPAMNNAQFSAFYASMSRDFSDFKVWLAPETEPIIDEASRRVVIQLKSQANGTNGVYSNEYIFVLLMSEDGTLLDELVEFIDSAYVLSYFKSKSTQD